MIVKELLSLASHKKMDEKYNGEFLRFNALLSTGSRDHYGYLTIIKDESGKLSIDTKIGSLRKIEVMKDEAQELIRVVNSSHAAWLNKGYVCNLIYDYIEQTGDKFLIDTDNSEVYSLYSVSVTESCIDVGVICKGYSPFRADIKFTYEGQKVTAKNAHQFSGGTNEDGDMVIVYNSRTLQEDGE